MGVIVRVLHFSFLVVKVKLVLTVDGHPTLVHVLDFQQYFYYPAPDFTNDHTCSHSHQPLTNLDIENVAVAPNGSPLRFLKFFVSGHH
jgi:hypothetical protein